MTAADTAGKLQFSLNGGKNCSNEWTRSRPPRSPAASQGSSDGSVGASRRRFAPGTSSVVHFVKRIEKNQHSNTRESSAHTDVAQREGMELRGKGCVSSCLWRQHCFGQFPERLQMKERFSVSQKAPA